jgi:hypothetical protein
MGLWWLSCESSGCLGCFGETETDSRGETDSSRLLDQRCVSWAFFCSRQLGLGRHAGCDYSTETTLGGVLAVWLVWGLRMHMLPMLYQVRLRTTPFYVDEGDQACSVLPDWDITAVWCIFGLCIDISCMEYRWWTRSPGPLRECRFSCTIFGPDGTKVRYPRSMLDSRLGH